MVNKTVQRQRSSKINKFVQHNTVTRFVSTSQFTADVALEPVRVLGHRARFFTGEPGGLEARVSSGGMLLGRRELEGSWMVFLCIGIAGHVCTHHFHNTKH